MNNKAIEEVMFTSDPQGGMQQQTMQGGFTQQAPQKSSIELEGHLIKARSGNQDSVLFLINYYCNRADHYNALLFFKLFQHYDESMLVRYYLSFTKIPLTKTSFNFLVDIASKGHEQALMHIAQILDNDNFEFLNYAERKNLYLKLYSNNIIYFNEQLGDILYLEGSFEEALVLYETLIEYNALYNYRNIADIYYLHLEEKNYEKAFQYYSYCEGVHAVFCLAEMFEQGLGVEKDEDKAYELYINAINSGNSEAKFRLIPTLLDEGSKYYNPNMAFAFADECSSYKIESFFYLGFCYLHGLGVEENDRLAFNCFLRVSSTNDPLHIQYLADCYLNATGIMQDLDRAIELYSRLPKSNETNGKLLKCYIAKKDQYQIFKLLESVVLVDTTNAEYLYMLAKYHLDGVYTNRNTELGFRYLKSASSNGSVEALYDLACEYFQTGITIKQEEAIEWYEQLAEKEHKLSIEFLFNYYKETNIAKAYKYAKVLEGTNDHSVLLFLAKQSLNGTEINLADAFRYNKYLADNGHKELFNLVGDFYYHGLAVDKNDDEAFAYYMKASNNKDPKALYSLGMFYENGIVVNKDFSLAYRYYSDADKLGDLRAKFAVANFVEHGIHVNIDFETAFDIYNQLSKIDSYALVKVGMFYEKGMGCEKNINKAISQYTLALEQGQFSAALALAAIYENGDLVKKDYSKAYGYYKKIESHNSEAQFKLGQYHEEGLFVKKDIYEALRYYKMAANNNNSEAKKMLGDCCLVGVNMDQDYNKAVAYYEGALINGNKTVYYPLANCYYEGNGVEKNCEKAFQLYKKAVNNKDVNGYFGLANCYYTGNGVVQDYSEAYRLYDLCAKHDIKEAYTKLGSCFEEGLGVSKDINKAIQYFNFAVENSSDAKFKLGKYYLEGIYVDKDNNKGTRLLEEASGLDHVEAMLILADYYKNTEVAANLIRTFELFKKASEAGSRVANKEYALCLYFGKGTTADKALACEIFKEDQFKNDYEIRYYLASYLKEIIKPEHDSAEIISHLEFCAENKYEKAILDLANIYYEGELVNSDLEKAFEYYDVLERTNDRKVLFRLASYYQLGVHCEKDMEKSIELYEKLSLMNDEESINALGEIYYSIERFDKAFQLFDRIAEKSIDANYNRNVCYLYGNGVDINTKLATKKLEALAKKGYAKAINIIGELYLNGEVYKENKVKAIKHFEDSNEIGCEKALLNLAECYLTGNGVKKDPREAFNMYVRGSIKQHPIATNKLGEMYEEGIVIFQDLDKAFDYYLAAVNLGNNKAGNNLAKMYYNGISVERDVDKAVKHFKKADKDGFTDASAYLGNCYFLGEGVVRDYTKALELFNKSSDMSFSKNKIGECYENGTGVPENKYLAFKYYTEAAYDNVDAQFNLARCYEYGVNSSNINECVMIDTNLAKQYYTKAALSGHELAKEALADIKVQPYNKI